MEKLKWVIYKKMITESAFIEDEKSEKHGSMNHLQKVLASVGRYSVR